MPHPISVFKGYKGPAILAASAVTLIAALAIPRASEERQSSTLVPFEVKSTRAGEVKRTEVQTGSLVIVGQTLMVLTDPTLEKEIVRLEDELKIAMLGTKTAVAEPGMLGVIGSMPRVTWQIPDGPIAEPNPTAPASTPDLAGPIQKELKILSGKETKAKAAFEAKDADLQDAITSVTLAETELSSIRSGDDASTKEKEKLQRLYDMGAIPKRRLDAAVSASEQASKDVQDAQAKVDEAKARQADLERDLSSLKSDLANLKAQLEDIQSKLETAEAKVKSSDKAPSKPQTPVTTPKPVRKLVYSTSPESNAPVQVKLLDAEEPGAEKQIEAIRTKLLELKAKREDLRIKATQSGRIVWIAEPGSNVIPGARIVTIQPLQ